MTSSILTAEQQVELENFRKRAVETRRVLKDLRKNLRIETDALEFWTKVVNIGLVPLLVALAGLVLAWATPRLQKGGSVNKAVLILLWRRGAGGAGWRWCGGTFPITARAARNRRKAPADLKIADVPKSLPGREAQAR